MRYGKYILFVYNKITGKKVAFFTAEDEEVVLDMVCNSRFHDQDKYEHEMVEPEIVLDNSRKTARVIS